MSSDGFDALTERLTEELRSTVLGLVRIWSYRRAESWEPVVPFVVNWKLLGLYISLICVPMRMYVGSASDTVGVLGWFERQVVSNSQHYRN